MIFGVSDFALGLILGAFLVIGIQQWKIAMSEHDGLCDKSRPVEPK